MMSRSDQKLRLELKKNLFYVENIFRMLKTLGLIAALLSVIALYAPAQTPADAGSMEKPEDEKSFQDYVVKTYCDPGSGTGKFEVYQKGQLVYKENNYHFYIGLIDRANKEGNELVAMGHDLTGRGIPNLLISEWSGGAHCCYTFYLFEIGKEFKKVAEIKAEHSSLSYFKDLDEDKKLEFVSNDWVFAYWHTGFAQSPAPQIILRFQNNQYVLATDLMRRPAPAVSEIESKIHEIRQSESWQAKEPPVDLWAWMLEWIYSGHAKLAWEFFDKAWLEKIPGKKKFLSEFRSQLSKSPYWPQIKKMNGI